MKKVRVFQPSSKTVKEFDIETPMEYGFIDLNGKEWCVAMVDSYNVYNYDINKCTYQTDRDFLLDNRHKYFCLQAGIQGF